MQQITGEAIALRQPCHGIFELTARCNLSCRMCYVRHPADNKIQQDKEIPAIDWLEIARQASHEGMVFLLLTGGEVLLRPDFFEILEPLSRMGFMLTIFTNGTLVTEEVALRLAQAPPNRIEISLYGSTAATYESVTGIRGSFAACCEGIEALLNHRVPLGLKTTVSRYNMHELDSMRNMAHNWGLKLSASWLLIPRPDGLPSDAVNCRISVEDGIALEKSGRAWSHDSTESAIREASTRTNDDNFYCAAGKSAFVVNPSGEMNACLDLPFPAARPLDIGFKAAWEEVQHFVDSAPVTSNQCRSCDVRTFCGRCPAWSWMHTGTLAAPVPYWCEIARSRKEHRTDSA